MNEQKLDLFLDAFLEGRSPAAAVDTDFWDGAAKKTAGEEPFSERDPVLAAPPKKGRLPRRTVAAIFIILIAIPVTIWVGLTFWNDRKYMAVSLLLVLYSVIPFFLVFESRKPQAREIMVIAVLIAIAVGSRAAFFMLANFKVVGAIAIISGVCFGAESGFLVGSMSMLASNMLFGQGPWTPYQMFAMGIIGFLAGLLFQKRLLKATKLSLCIYGFLATVFIYGGIMNPASLLMMSYEINGRNLLAIYMSGLPVDLVHATANALFLWLASRPMIEKLERIKVKYGLIQ